MIGAPSGGLISPPSPSTANPLKHELPGRVECGVTAPCDQLAGRCAEYEVAIALERDIPGSVGLLK